MGHDHHFLSRLDRVSLQHAETALGLYRDHELVREILNASSAPRDASRIAISLADPVTGPFLVVARNGHFVTCLGQGMRSDLPVVSREELDLITRDLEGFRRAETGIAANATLRDVVGRVLRHGEVLLAEDVAELRAVQPIVEDAAFRGLMESQKALITALPAVRRAVKRKGRRARALSTRFMRLSWLHRNYLIVMGLGSLRKLRDVTRKLPGITLTRLSLELELNFLVLAAGWLAAQIGAEAIDSYAIELQSPTWNEMGDGVLGLACIGARHPELRERVRDVLRAGPPGPHGKLHPLPQMALAALNLDEAEGVQPVARQAAQAWAFKGQLFFAEGAEAAEQVSADDAMTWAFQSSANVMKGASGFLDSLVFAMAAAQGEAEQLCLPRRWAHLHSAAVSSKSTHQIAAGLRAEHNVPQPVRAEETPGRNAPCPCGSGKKFKRCCMAAQGG